MTPLPMGVAAGEARAMGMTGALCIHPDQVGPVNVAFAPDADDLSHASAVVREWDLALAAEKSVTELNGRMIDRPVVERERRLLAGSSID